MNHDYWDPEDVLAETQRVPCTFNVDLPGMGFLEGTGEADVRKNARAELPYWMAALLAVYDIITIQQPKAYAARVRAALNASATSVQLRNLAPQWYALAERLAQLLGSDEMRDMLAKVCVHCVCADRHTWAASRRYTSSRC